MLTVGKDALQVERQLKAGLLECPGCGGRLAPWGYARSRLVFGVGKIAWRLRPRRARCAGCAASHVLLPVSVLLRRRDAVAVIGSALLAVASGMGCGQVARRLGRAVATVRGWVGRFAGRAEQVRQIFTVLAVELQGELPVGAAGPPVADAVAAIAAAMQAVRDRWAAAVTTLSRWEMVCAITRGTLLAPSIMTGPINTNHILS
ncbi:hypothetical protein Acor_40770 [Acrocarpospora corrugata]|uniref:Uncharacterized protein n=1 Tax=Acrocarpospora corrugata TaxID=35763 RepID=A0A5M3W1W0_9ACTN|nr:hypothetical protein [Acrocarpospora corrugata]GES02012.1 hypothetical protein Acor_40770 [Acrocarpospora corrugata]